MSETTGRFAPSPSGRMHLGNLFCALIAFLSAKSRGGRFILRIEDLDPDRSKLEYSSLIEEDLSWLGITWNEGGLENRGKNGPYLQSERAQLYEAALSRLAQRGLIYPCFCSRADLHSANAPHRSDGQLVYSGRCRSLSSQKREALAGQRSPALRIRVPEKIFSFDDGVMGHYLEYLPTDCGDFILRRSDGVFAYQLAVVLDDAMMGVTEVVRGGDLLTSTPRQLFLYEQLGLTPPAFYHLPLLTASDGRRLSKRDGDLDLGALRKRFSPNELLGILAFCSGIIPSPESIGMRELIGIFNWSKIPKSDIALPEGLFAN